MRRWTSVLPTASATISLPSLRMPVPASTTTRVPESERTSTHDVLPPYRSVFRPGTGSEPRTPQNLTLIEQPLARVDRTGGARPRDAPVDIARVARTRRKDAGDCEGA